MEHKLAATPTEPSSGGPMQSFVRVIGSRRDTYVEFEFSVNDRDLTVELILPFRAFEEFCQRQNAVVLPPEPAVAEALERQAWRLHQPGLLRHVAGRAREGAGPQADAPAAGDAEARARGPRA